MMNQDNIHDIIFIIITIIIVIALQPSWGLLQGNYSSLIKLTEIIISDMTDDT